MGKEKYAIISPALFFLAAATINLLYTGSESKDLFLREILPVCFPCKMSLTQDDDSLRHTQQLLHIRRYHQYGFAILGQLFHQQIYFVPCPDVNAACCLTALAEAAVVVFLVQKLFHIDNLAAYA